MDFADRLERGRAGDPAALEALFAPWRPLLRLQADRVLGAELAARLDPSDVVQEALSLAYTQLDDFRGGCEGEWVNWLRSIVAGQAANARRFHTADKRTPDREGGDVLACARDGPTPSEQAQIREEDGRLAAALAQLPEAMRQVIVRRVFHLEPFEAVARALGRSPGATRVLWTRALRRLQQLLEPGP
jgi:RNA polymerase sigma-70 factor (ECF subfamily)